jgi:hypothetical protein
MYVAVYTINANRQRNYFSRKPPEECVSVANHVIEQNLTTNEVRQPFEGKCQLNH